MVPTTAWKCTTSTRKVSGLIFSDFLIIKGPKLIVWLYYATGCSEANLNFWDSPQSINKGHFLCILSIFINLGLWIFVIFIDIPFLTCFIEIQGILKIKRIWLFSWNRVISYGEKCFKHCFSRNFTFFSVVFTFSCENATINCN